MNIFNVVITGATRGIGLGMAHAFLARGHRVMICGRAKSSMNAALDELHEFYGKQRVAGQICDLSNYDDVQKLWNTTVKQFGDVDIWVNNAGMSTANKPLWEQNPNDINAVVQTNMTGLMYGCSVAIGGMLKQGYGWVYNMEGLGSNGMITPGMLVYGSTKSALTYLTEGLVKETKKTPVKVGFLSPGMVVTDLLLTSSNGRKSKIFNVLADRVETVAPWLVEQMLANDKHGAKIAWLTKGKIWRRFLTAPFSRRNVFEPSK
ncbi:MAG: SDR family oxidoreductase [Herpetosiphon sp.]|nr:SDR family oxidoreductase [Herpetosiphon sp.]